MGLEIREAKVTQVSIREFAIGKGNHILYTEAIADCVGVMIHSGKIGLIAHIKPSPFFKHRNWEKLLEVFLKRIFKIKGLTVCFTNPGFQSEQTKLILQEIKRLRREVIFKSGINIFLDCKDGYFSTQMKRFHFERPIEFHEDKPLFKPPLYLTKRYAVAKVEIRK